MATVDQVAGTEEVPVAPRPAAPLPPPPPGAQPVTTADGKPVRRTTRKVTRRPIPRGTAAVSGGAVVGTLLTVVYAAAGPIALVATAAGTVAIPLIMWRRYANSRTTSRAGARRAARQQRGGSRRNGGGWTSPRSRRGSGGGLGLGNPLAGLGGGGGRGRGSRSTGRSLFGAGAGAGGRKGKTGKGGVLGGAASGGLGGSSRRRGDGSRTVAGRRGGASRQVTPKVGRNTGRPGGGLGGGGKPPKNNRGGNGGGWKPPKGAKPNTPSTPKPSKPAGSKPSPSTRGGAGGGWKPPKGAPVPKTGVPKPASTSKPAGATAPSTTTPTTPKVKKVKKTRPGYGPQGRGGAYGAWTPPRRSTRRGRAASAANHGLWKAGSAFLHGVRRPGARRAWRSAYRRYGAHGYNPTATGFLGRVAGGVAAAVPAWLARLAWITAKKLALSIRDAYNPPVTAPAAQQQRQQQPQPTQQQHPVPAPAFTSPPPAPAPRPGPRPSPRPRTPQQPAPTGGGSSPNQHGGPTPMTTVFPPASHAIDFFGACTKWSPAGEGINGAIWHLHDAIPHMQSSLTMVLNGWAQIVTNCETGLQGAYHAPMRAAMCEVYTPLREAAVKAAELQKVFATTYADAMARRNVRGGQALNV